MTKFSKALVSGVFATSLLASPAAFAQTAPATSTGGAKEDQDRGQMDAVRDHQTATPMKKTHRANSVKAQSKPKNGKPLGPTNTRS